ncbi:uncharacterized protein CTHT_0028770 [Thermochaetoides thermophila DSM 1495]|uniref:Uncharacterized protein n=1 Tax=Chaetomium thermophilum (strain DSM 1495 / CBS 144.50 / IMI 039719) TaxID=759272 RepID=G0S7T7_CHATD|nr:hypothetical protein CTHT_0028770 [Thermochaetoides thermophila DSM 1495]EGS21037.1 hypothetical protein CTHT_0028770 [Thermochaetoides thermophila DSM 1495]
MASLVAAARLQRRDSTDRRSKLLRASATVPTITTTTAGGNAIASVPTRRASELLTRVAIIAGSPSEPIVRSQPVPSRSPTLDSVDRQSDLSVSPVSQPDFGDMHEGFEARYFSFPSFDLYESSRREDEKDDGPKSP